MTITPDDIPISSAYAAISHAFKQYGSQHHYYQDFSHWDRASLSHNPPRFLWILGNCFTNLLMFKGQTSHEILEYRLAQNGEQNRVFAYEYGSLREVQPEEARLFLEYLPHPCELVHDNGYFWLKRGAVQRPLTQAAFNSFTEREQAATPTGENRWDRRALHQFLADLECHWQNANPI